MKKFFLSATIVALVVALGSLVSPVRSQAPGGAQASGQNIAVIDIGQIFKEHARFKAAMERMQADVKDAEQNLKKERDEMTALAEQLKGFNPGTPDYKGLEATIVERQGAFQAKATLQKKEFLERESKIYFTVYREVEDAVRQFSENPRNNISLVLRFNSDPVDPNDRNEILRGINKPIVYVEPSLDITNLISKNLNRSATPGTDTAPKGPVGLRPPR